MSPLAEPDPGAGRRGSLQGGAAERAVPPEPGAMDRRSFIRVTGSAGGVLLGGSLTGVLSACGTATAAGARGTSGVARGASDAAVVGAGAFGVWTAFHLQEMGARVALIDLYGPGNSRSTSGDETRGVRSSYPGRELWTAWADRAMQRWRAFDDEWAAEMGGPLFFPTGDVILREAADPFIDETREVWDLTGVPYEVLTPDEVRYRWPQIDVDGMEAALFEPGAGVVRARAACQRVAALVQRRGGEIRIGRAAPGAGRGGRLAELRLDAADVLGAEVFVFALGPWFPTAFPELMAERMRIPIGHVYYFGTPPGDRRFEYPNLPSWNFPGVTGWPSLPPDYRGFRVRTGGRPGDDPDTSARWIPEEYHEQPRQLLAERFPDLAGEPLVETRACHYESSATRDWIIDRHPDWENVWLAGGGSAEGFKFGPVVGELIAGRVLERDLHPELDDRFRLAELETAVGAHR